MLKHTYRVTANHETYDVAISLTEFSNIVRDRKGRTISYQITSRRLVEQIAEPYTSNLLDDTARLTRLSVIAERRCAELDAALQSEASARQTRR